MLLESCCTTTSRKMSSTTTTTATTGKISGKRPLRSLTAHEKLEAIKRVHEGESKASVARDIGVPESTLRGWCKNEEKITYISRQSSPVDNSAVATTVDDTTAPAATSPQSAASSASPVRETSSPDCGGGPPREKKPKIAHEDGVVTPFNLSIKTNNGGGRISYSPNSEIKYAVPVDFSTKTITTTATATTTIMDDKPPKVESSSSSMGTMKAPTVAQQLSERERNRAELARLSIELGLNRPEMYSSATDLAASTANLSLLTQWNNLLLQQAQKKSVTCTAQADTTASAATNTTNLLASTSQLLLQTAAAAAAYGQNGAKTVTSTQVDDKTKLAKLEPPKSVEESVWYWLKSQQAMLGINPQSTTVIQPVQIQPQIIQNHQQVNGNGISSSNNAAAAALLLPALQQTNGDVSGQTSWFWKWYKQYTQAAQVVQQSQPLPNDNNRHLLYQQLVKDKDLNNENKCVISSTTSSNQPAVAGNKVRAVLDNLMLNNNNNNVSSVQTIKKIGDKDDDIVTPTTHQEGLECGEKFLKWLESCGDPSVTAMQIMQLRGLINNIKLGAERKNGLVDAVHQRQKVRRK